MPAKRNPATKQLNKHPNKNLNKHPGKHLGKRGHKAINSNKLAQSNKPRGGYFLSVILLILPVAALLVYFLELRIQATLIPRVAVSLENQQVTLSGVDKAILAHSSYLWRSPLLREQLVLEGDQVELSPFYMDRFEVSQRNYRKFLNWLAIQPEELRYLYVHDSEPVGFRYQNPHSDHSILGRLETSVSGVSFYAAHAYCRAAGGNLPTIDQWMAAAAGKEQRSYPWGEDFIGDSWRYSDPLLNLAAPTENRKNNATPQGIYDLGNGLSEWTLDMSDDNRFILKGGNNYNRPFQLQSLSFIERPVPADFLSKYNGFRCIYDADDITQAARLVNLPWQENIEAIFVEGGAYSMDIGQKSYAPKLVGNLEQSSPAVIASFLSVSQSSQETEEVGAISKYEITRSEYAKFLRDPLARLGFYANQNEPKSHSYVPDNWRQQIAEPDLPVVGVDWWSAYAYAKWAGGRLPSEQEWLQVFAGEDKNPFVWGENYEPGAAHTRDASQEIFPDSPQSAVVENSESSNNKDITATGVTSLAGNVSEWTKTVAINAQGAKMVVKGGNFKFPGDIGAHYSYDAKVPPNHRSDAIGIRVVFYDG